MNNKKTLLIVSVLIFSLGSAVTLGWIFDVAILKSVIPGYVSMTFNSALCLIISGFLLFVLINNKNKYLVSLLSVLLLLIGTASFSQDIFKYELGIDQLLFFDTQSASDQSHSPGRMASTTALCFSLFGFSILLSQNNRSKSIAQYLLHLISLISFIAIVGYLFDVPSFYRLSFLSSMAVHTSIAFFLLSISASLLNPSFGLAPLFIGKTIGSKMARRLFPRMFVSIVGLSLFRVALHRFGLVDVEFGIALFATSFVVVGLFFIWGTANSLDKSDISRVRAEDEVKSLNLNLEKLVALRNQELRAIFDSAHVSIIGTDLFGVINNFSKGAESLLGYTAEDMIGKETPAILHLQDEVIRRGNELTAEFGREIRGFDVFVEFAKQGKPESREWTYVRRDSTTFPVQLVVTSILDDERKIRGYLGIATDITDLSKVKGELEVLSNHLQKQNKQLLNFAHITSHNLRSPVSNLNSLLHFYKESTSEDDKIMLFSKFETVIYHLTTTLNELIESLKIQEDLSKERELLAFEDILNRTKETLAGHIIETKAVITGNFSKAESIEYPKSYLESIMLNLCSNAIKYRSTERIPNIHFETVATNDGIIMTATDNGLGIDLERHGSKLFGLNKTFHRHPEAKGVGLFITKTQVEAMGGHISAKSEVDKGTIFKIIFNRKK